jgi:hypothetical protein
MALSRADPDAGMAPSSGSAGGFSAFGLFKFKKRGLMAVGSSLVLFWPYVIFYDFFGLRTPRKVLSVSKLREDPDFGASSASSAVKI